MLYARIDPPDPAILPIDHAGLIFPYLAKKDMNNVFRLQAELDACVEPFLLQKALYNVRKRCPVFVSCIYKTATQYKLKNVNAPESLIQKGCRQLCAPFDLKRQALVRICHEGSLLAVEFFHAVTDGYGASIFLKTLLAEYYRLQGEDIPCADGILNCGEAPRAEETRDDYLTHYEPKRKNLKRFGTLAFQYSKRAPSAELRTVCIRVPAENVRLLARQAGLTVTQFLTALYLLALNSNRAKGDKKPVMISVPINLRRILESRSLRNFSLVFTVRLPEGENKIDAIAESVRAQFRENTQREHMLGLISTNVAQSELAVFKYAPLFVKKAMIKIGYALVGESLFTSTISSLGEITLPDKLRRHVLDFRFIIGETLRNKINCTVSSYNGILTVTLSSRSSCEDAERYMADYFERHGIAVER